MKFKELKNKIKEEQKQLALDIRKGKFARKPKNRDNSNYSYYENLYWNRVNYRHTHIAYCEFFNKTPYEKIEPNSKQEYPFNRSKIDSLKAEWEKSLFSLEWDDLE